MAKKNREGEVAEGEVAVEEKKDALLQRDDRRRGSNYLRLRKRSIADDRAAGTAGRTAGEPAPSRPRAKGA